MKIGISLMMKVCIPWTGMLLVFFSCFCFLIWIMHALIPEYTIFTHQNLVDGSVTQSFEIYPDPCFLLAGLSFAKDLPVDVQNGVGSPKSKSTFVQKEKDSSFGEHGIENESAYTHSEDDSARSPPGSPGGRIALESPSQEHSNSHFRKSSEAETEIHRYGADSCNRLFVFFVSFF